MAKRLFLDLFAGGGGLSEGFVRAGFGPVAHVESDAAACHTLRTRAAYRWLKDQGRLGKYAEYLHGGMTRDDFYAQVPPGCIDSVINEEIGSRTVRPLFRRVDELLRGRKLDIVVGGPPCQAYSIVGRSRDKVGMLRDSRNYLYIYYARFLSRYQPRYFIFENVIGLFSAREPDGSRHYEHMRHLFQESGYKLKPMVLLAQDYGVLQQRKRLVLVGKRGNDDGFDPQPQKWPPSTQVREVFEGLPAIGAEDGGPEPCKMEPCSSKWQRQAGVCSEGMPVTLHWSRPQRPQDLEIYRRVVEHWNEHKQRLRYWNLPKRLKTHRNQRAFGDRFKVVAEDLPHSQTVMAHITRDGHYYIHPSVEQNRSITPREAARLQTFPDDYHFESLGGPPRRTPAYRQIGNAVPVLLAQKVAERLQEIW